MLLGLDMVRFDHCLKPVSATEDPSLITFSDRNPEAFGVCSYILYDLEDGSKSAALMMAKAKLGPLTRKGETVKNELYGSVLASRMKIWLIQESGVFFKEHHHFVDSMIVNENILNSIYGYNMFFGLRVGEIQQKSNFEDISDVLTGGCSPKMLEPGSIWQNDPMAKTIPNKLACYSC